jgi:CDP-diacylglycerol--serine O-phosphatidyltransferase
LLVSIVLFLIFRFSQVALFSMTLIYMFSGIWARAAYSWSRRRRRHTGSDSSAELEEPPANPNPWSN